MTSFSRSARCLLIIGFLTLLAPPLFAQTLAKFDFTGLDGAQTDATPVEGSTPAGVTVSPITRGDGFALSTPGPFTQNSFAIRMVPGLNNFEEAAEQRAYFEITITPDPGKTVTVERISFNSKRATKKSGPLFMVVRGSLDDYSTDLAGPLNPLPVELPEGSDLELTFAGALNDLTKPVTLRFYAYGRNEPHNPSGGLWVVGNSAMTGGFTIEGTVSP